MDGLCKFLSSIRNAPEEIKSIVKELHLLETVLKGIQRNEELYGPQPAVADALQGCRENITALHAIVDPLAPGFATQNSFQRKWNATKGARKSEKVADFRAKLQEAKITLLLAQQISASQSQHSYHESEDHKLTTITTRTAELSRHLSDVHAEVERLTASFSPPILRHALTEEIHKAVQQAIGTDTVNSLSARSESRRGGKEEGLDRSYQKKRTRLLDETATLTPTPFGDLWCLSRRYAIRQAAPGWSQQETEFQTTFRFVPSWWLRKCGLSSIVIAELGKSSQAGWQFRLNTQNLLPSDSPIFTYCYRGDLHSVRRLLESRQASVHDVSSSGVTPLHCAAQSCSAKLCSFLLSAGADANAVDSPGGLYDSRTPLRYVWRYADREISALAKMNTIRTLIEAETDLEDQVVGASRRDSPWQYRGLFEENDVPGADFESPAIYLVNEILRLVRPGDLGSTWWGNRLAEVLIWAPSPAPMRDFIMKFCDMLAIRIALLHLIDAWASDDLSRYNILKWNPNRTCSTAVKDCRVLMSRFESLDTLHFKLGDPLRYRYEGDGAYECLTTMALRSSRSWSTYLTALQQLDTDIEEFARQEVAILNEIGYQGGGWTEEAVVRLYMHTAKPIIETREEVWIRCSAGFSWRGPHYGSIHEGGEEVWMQAVERIRQGKSPHGPFDGDEQRVYKDWQRFARIFNEQRLCYPCQKESERIRAEEEKEREELDGYSWMFEGGRIGHEEV